MQIDTCADLVFCVLQHMLTPETAVLVETGDSWFYGNLPVPPILLLFWLLLQSVCAAAHATARDSSAG